MKALVCPDIIVYGNEERTQQGYRITNICETEFDVASPWFWIDVPDGTIEREKYYDPEDQQLKDRWHPPLPPEPDDIPENPPLP